LPIVWKDGQGALVCVGVTADHDGERACLCAPLTARDGRVKEGDAAFSRSVGEPLGQAGRGRAHVNRERARAHCWQRSVLAREPDTLDGRVVGQAGDDHLALRR